MSKKLFAIFISSVLTVVSFAQTGVKPVTLVGEAASVDASRIMLTTKDGPVSVELTASTEFKRVPADNPKLSAAVPSSLSELSAGDRLVVTGILADDKKSIPARSIYLMTSSDIASKQRAEAQRWATRGISGKVVTANKDTGQIAIEVRGLMGSQNVTITPKPNAKLMRYQPDSVQYSEAIAGTVADIQAGDMVRALGDRSSDGLSFAADEIVSGAFRTVAGTVKSVSADGREVVITDLNSKKDITVAISSGSALKRFPPEMAMRLAGMGGAGGANGQAAAGGQPGGRPAAAGQGQPGQGGGEGTAGPGRPGMGGARGGIDDMFERFPAITAGELKAGDMIAVSSSKTNNEERITAIKLLAGVEPFIRAAQMQQSTGTGRGRGSQGSGFSIPGLDGFDFP